MNNMYKEFNFFHLLAVAAICAAAVRIAEILHSGL